MLHRLMHLLDIKLSTQQNAQTAHEVNIIAKSVNDMSLEALKDVKESKF